MDTEALKQKIITAVNGINDEIALLEILRFITDYDSAQSGLREPETGYGQINSIQKDSIVSESFYKVLDKERTELINNPKLGHDWATSQNLIFKD